MEKKYRYIGKGFLGFDKEKPEMELIEFDGAFDAWVFYQGGKMLVRKYEIEEV